MPDVHLDHPGDFHWLHGYGPRVVLGECPHVDCLHTAITTVAWGPDGTRYELVDCDAACAGNCRAWINGRGVATTPWLHVGATA